MKSILALGVLGASIAPPLNTHVQHVKAEVRSSHAYNGNLIDTEGILPNPKYILSNVRIHQSKSFDFTGNDHHGEFDWLAYGGTTTFDKSFSMFNTYGWDNRCNAHLKSTKIQFTFKDNKNNVEESYYLYYNTGRSSSEPRDYAFVAIQPGRKADGTLNSTTIAMNSVYAHASSNLHDPKAATLFGLTLAWHDMESYRDIDGFEALRHGAHIVNEHMLAGTKTSSNISAYKGDYLEGIDHRTIEHPDVSDYNYIQGNGILKGVARDLAKWIYFELNTKHSWDN